MKKYYGHPDFYKLLDELKELHSNKNHDYAGENDPFRNLKLSEMMGIKSWKGCLIRISDKFSRLCSFAKKEEYKVKDEGVEDTLKDLAIYSIICLILYREGNKEEGFDRGEYIREILAIPGSTVGNLEERSKDDEL